MNIIIIHGPNINMLGKRDPVKYGTISFGKLNDCIKHKAQELGITVSIFQSNHEGTLIDYLQSDVVRKADGVVVNPGALVRYGYSFRQALVDLDMPFVEVHMSDIAKTGVMRNVNVLNDVAVRVAQVCGLKELSYMKGLKIIIEYIKKNL